MNIGKKIRIKRIVNRKSGKTVIIPMDHGVSLGPIQGLEDIDKTVNMILRGGANATVVHKGIVTSTNRSEDTDIGLIIHLSASTSLNPFPNNKISVCDVDEALALGADAVSVHVNIGADGEAAMLESLGRTARECNRWGIPLLAMMYPRGDLVEVNVESVKLAARVGAELGADIIKCPYTGSAKSFEAVVRGCPVPVVIAGGSKLSDEETLDMIEGAMTAGAAGLSMGRNVFQHEDPEHFVRVACEMVHNGMPAKQALKMLRRQL
ncbi:MAG: 2-amino-3,7-dideoxy-D-threo-hept-6-ulosonate synthase [Desulfobacterales bacterium]|jgi:predicted phospho-2-dehydro-3-deoxyheptonate aldolase|nr:2-amino-3,7-dideoxy-D-threo-hept-6-ulosonate synthase [Desulfobacterales bacterium]MDD3951932.1 2-amino-3,7-dideoxy-D-threo-hept-6-ulosonate synthase [Desulfobacterales bacterium]MDD4464339.1 2-amino-3,7-dideoxy-D-threo-hept-6-ulosonate synthase [Desulfobacterales bacterium]MDY0377861.1 2-amino-3,7-dideoxy-D-threo-hept-6-ulosonate synthase [Desulfobacterales bacterium]